MIFAETGSIRLVGMILPGKGVLPVPCRIPGIRIVNGYRRAAHIAGEMSAREARGPELAECAKKSPS